MTKYLILMMMIFAVQLGFADVKYSGRNPAESTEAVPSPDPSNTCNSPECIKARLSENKCATLTNAEITRLGGQGYCVQRAGGVGTEAGKGSKKGEK